MIDGTLFVVAAPSGAGKSTLVNALLEREPDISLSISHTTRPPRVGEQYGRHYFFVKRSDFEKEIAEGIFLEHAEVHSNLYGTSRNSSAVCAVEDLTRPR
jgi:guanylate kinase